MTLPDYVTLAEVKAYAPTNEVATTTAWDDMVTTLCTNCSRAWDSLTFRQPGAYAVDEDTTRYFDGIPITATDFASLLTVGELVALTSVSVSPNNGSFTPLDSVVYWLVPYNAPLDGKPYTGIELNPNGGRPNWPTAKRSIQVIGKFGYSASVPADVLEALLLYVIRMVRKAQQNYLEVGTLLDSGQIMTGMKVDPDLRDLIQLYRRGRL